MLIGDLLADIKSFQHSFDAFFEFHDIFFLLFPFESSFPTATWRLKSGDIPSCLFKAASRSIQDGLINSLSVLGKQKV